MRYILLVALVALLSVACQRRPMDEEYLKVYLDLTIDKKVTNHEYTDPGLMRVAFFDSFTGEYLSHDYVESTGGYVHAPYGDVDIVVYNLNAGNTYVRNDYSWNYMEAYTDEISELQRSRFTRYIQSRADTRPSYDDIRLTPSHLYVARERNIHIPRHITDEVLIIRTTAKSVVESWDIEVESITGMEHVGSVTMMISGQASSHFMARNQDSEIPVALYFDVISAQRRNTVLYTGFETFGREKTNGESAILSILFTDIMGHPYMYNFDVSDQMENNPKQKIYIKADINIPKPEAGGGFKPDVDGWYEHNYDIEI